jgi:hypothetical protein
MNAKVMSVRGTRFSCNSIDLSPPFNRSAGFRALILFPCSTASAQIAVIMPPSFSTRSTENLIDYRPEEFPHSAADE